ncbi:MAG: DUF4340 domain-containing protein [Candidatus Dojkabacteria bacterium]|nr:DUF4340 domain-containing protein [Candidatus Dojkabacteria bacterium]
MKKHNAQKLTGFVFLLFFLLFLTIILSIRLQYNQEYLIGFSDIDKIIIDNKNTNSKIQLIRDTNNNWLLENTIKTDNFIVEEVINLIKQSRITDIVSSSEEFYKIFDLNDNSTILEVFNKDVIRKVKIGKTSNTNGTYVLKDSDKNVYHISKNLNYFTSYTKYDFIDKQINSFDKNQIEYIQINNKKIVVNQLQDNGSYTLVNLEQKDSEVVDLVSKLRSIRAVDESVILNNFSDYKKNIIKIKLIGVGEEIIQEAISVVNNQIEEFYYKANNLFYQISSIDWKSINI